MRVEVVITAVVPDGTDLSTTLAPIAQQAINAAAQSGATGVTCRMSALPTPPVVVTLTPQA